MGNVHSDTKRIKFNIISSKDNAVNLLNEAEKIDMYLEECNLDIINFKARKNCNYISENITVPEQKYSNTFLDSVQENIPLRLRNELNEVNIIQLMSSAEGGMPHTRPGNIICYPSISRLYSVSTLVHELWHIHQRNNKELWTKVFNKLGWTEWTDNLPAELEKYRRYNPDTIDCPLWIFDNTWIPIPIFSDITKPDVSQVMIWFYNPHKNKRVHEIPPEILTYFGDLPKVAFEHPREITAYMLSDYEQYKENLACKKLLEEIGFISVVSR